MILLSTNYHWVRKWHLVYLYMLVLIDRLNKINYANCFFYCQQWSLLRIYNCGSTSGPLGAISFISCSFRWKSYHVKLSGCTPPPPGNPGSASLLTRFCWWWTPLKYYTYRTIHQQRNSQSRRFLSYRLFPKCCWQECPQRLFLLLAPIHSLWVIFQWDSGKME